MRFWDASALIPLVLQEQATPAVRALATEDPGVLTWWGAEAECASALARSEREGRFGGEWEATDAFRILGEIAHEWEVVGPSPEVKASAIRMLRVHPLRAANALQLAAAFTASGHRPQSLEFVTLDERLAQAARREGFPVLMPASH